MLAVARKSAAKERLGIEFIEASLQDGLPVDAGRFDLVVCALVLSHVPDLNSAARDFHRALKSGGLLLVTDFHPHTNATGMRAQPVVDGVTYQLPNEPHTRETYLEAVEEAGLELLKVLDLPTREAGRDRFSEGYWRKLADTNFCLIILAQKP